MTPGRLVLGYPPDHDSVVVLVIAVDELGAGTQRVHGLRWTCLGGHASWVLRSWITEAVLWKEPGTC